MQPIPNFSSIPFAVAALVAGLILLVGGGEGLVSGATKLARRLGMTPLVIGLTVVAFGTSVPELFVSLTASFQGYPDIMLGNVIGSNIANIGLILGCCCILSALQLNLREVWIELFLVILGSLVLMLASWKGYFPRWGGILFIVTLVGYTIFVYRSCKKKNNTTSEEISPGNPFVTIALILGGLVLLSFGSTLFIRGAVDVARYFGVSELVIGLTLAAVGTSLPELASSLAALRQNATSLLIGNVIGSNMFNLFMVLGLTSIVKPFTLSAELLVRDLPIMLAFTVVLIPMLMKDGRTKRWQGILLITAYLGYCASLL